METISAIKQTESRLLTISEKITNLGAKLEEIVFRAQRIAAAKKKGDKSTDTMFSYDLQGFRRDLRSFSHDIGSLPAALGSIERNASFDETAIKFAASIMRVAERLSKGLGALHDQALLAHSHIRESDSKVEAWFIIQELEQMADKGKSLPSAANRIMLIISTPPA